MSGPAGEGSRTGAAAGWYPDPDGTPGLVRWWNGLTWSDVTTPAGPGVAVGTTVEPGPARPSPSSWDAWGSAEPSPPPRRRRSPLLIGLGVIGLVLVLVGVLVGGSS